MPFVRHSSGTTISRLINTAIGVVGPVGMLESAGTTVDFRTIEGSQFEVSAIRPRRQERSDVVVEDK